MIPSVYIVVTRFDNGSGDPFKFECSFEIWEGLDKNIGSKNELGQINKTHFIN